MNELARPEARSVAEVRKELDESRRRLASSADALREDLHEGVDVLKRGAAAVKEKLDWKAWVNKNPWAFVAGALAVGIYLGTRNRE